MRPFFQDQGVKRRDSGAITRLCKADIDKMGSSNWVTLKCAGYIYIVQFLKAKEESLRKKQLLFFKVTQRFISFLYY